MVDRDGFCLMTKFRHGAARSDHVGAMAGLVAMSWTLFGGHMVRIVLAAA
jgi:hypothetical protein